MHNMQFMIILEQGNLNICNIHVAVTLRKGVLFSVLQSDNSLSDNFCNNRVDQ